MKPTAARLAIVALCATGLGLVGSLAYQQYQLHILSLEIDLLSKSAPDPLLGSTPATDAIRARMDNMQSQISNLDAFARSIDLSNSKLHGQIATAQAHAQTARDQADLARRAATNASLDADQASLDAYRANMKPSEPIWP
ncbi:hypothetical protein [Novosphingobium sp. FKTRR1]|uniref:hypothetical protein n=1 Tax=Novosphingobium sp. FKTRR1 TaxID=2879118 RepID=UPI001CEFEF54|nr:hypothetical protein [Novosphingobium sp. FKTRR1]